MSHCANYLVAINGEVWAATSRWGALSLLSGMFSGPDGTLDWLLPTLAPPDDGDATLYDEVMCEGAVLIDADRSRLLVWVGTTIENEPALRRPYVRLLGVSWPDWQVSWAAGGWPEIAREADLEVSDDSLRSRRPDRLPAQPVPLRGWKPSRYSRITTLLTIRDSAEAVDHPALERAPSLLALGPALIGLAAALPTIDTVLRTSPGLVSLGVALRGAEAGLLVDVPSSAVYYWMVDVEPSWLPEMLNAAWPGWSSRRLAGGLVEHVELCGHDPELVRMDPGQLRKSLTGFVRGSRHGLGGLLDELRDRATRPGVVVAPGALRPPPGPGPGPGQDPARERLMAVLDEIVDRG